MKIQWYPGHMTKARRMMQEDIKLIDLIIELLDARIPFSSRNPDIDSLATGKYRLILLNKSDLADDDITREWVNYYEEKGLKVIKLNSRQTDSMKIVSASINGICSEKFEKDRKKGIINRPVRAMVAGVPNVGKSTFINTFAGKACTRTGNKPGVTKGKQWIRLNKSVELLDTPGILWPRFDDERVGTNLAYTGSINDQIIDLSGLGLEFIELIINKYPGILEKRYNIKEEAAVKVLENIAISRGCLKKGGIIDYEKAAALVFDDFRSGKLGKISVERPEDF